MHGIVQSTCKFIECHLYTLSHLFVFNASQIFSHQNILAWWSCVMLILQTGTPKSKFTKLTKHSLRKLCIRVGLKFWLLLKQSWCSHAGTKNQTHYILYILYVCEPFILWTGVLFLVLRFLCQQQSKLLTFLAIIVI